MLPVNEALWLLFLFIQTAFQWMFERGGCFTPFSARIKWSRVVTFVDGFYNGSKTMNEVNTFRTLTGRGVSLVQVDHCNAKPCVSFPKFFTMLGPLWHSISSFKLVN